MPGSRHALRILDIDYLYDNSDDDLESVTALTYYRDGQSRQASNGFSVDATISDGEGGTNSALSASLGSTEIWIWLSETIPPPSVYILDHATQA